MPIIWVNCYQHVISADINRSFNLDSPHLLFTTFANFEATDCKMGVKQAEWNFSGNYMLAPFMTEIIEPSLTSYPLYIGAVPDSLAAIIERPDSEANNRPNKRRKLGTTGPRSLAQVHGLSEFGIPNGYTPLARLSLHLVGSNGSVEACGWTNYYLSL